MKLNQTLVVPKISRNLVSISKLIADIGVIVVFDSFGCHVKDKMGQIVAQGVQKDGLYELC